MSDNDDDRDAKGIIEAAKDEVEELGGWEAFRSGDWLLRLIHRAFRTYYQRATTEDLRQKYGSRDRDFIEAKLVKLACRMSALLGGVTGVAISADEIVGIVTAGEGGVGLPANIAVGGAAIMAEAVSLVRLQLKLVANLARLYEVPLDPDDPEDILIILAFALGGSAAEYAGKVAARAGTHLSKEAVRSIVSKDVLKQLQALGRKIGVKILQRTVLKYVVPLASIGIGAGWNYAATRTVAKVARKHLLARHAEMNPPSGAAAADGS